MKQSFRFFPRQVYDGVLLLAAAYISHQGIIACWLNPSCVYGGDLADYSLWGLIAIGAYLLLLCEKKHKEFLSAWRSNWPLGLFILYSVASISWSVAADRSIHTVYVMAASASTASIFAVIRPPKTIFRILFGFTLLVVTLSLTAVIVSPEIGIHPDPVWRGAWRGIFGHKNDFGPLMALGNGLAILLFADAKEKRSKTAAFAFYVLTLSMSIMSRSTTAVILCVMLNGLSAIYFAWIKWGEKLQGKPIVGIVAGIAGAGAFAIFMAFKLTGKSINLTGRVPLWNILLKDVISKKPWFGYGPGTLWNSPTFEKWAAQSTGWEGMIIVNGHNGYIDILLYLGAAGLFLLSFVLIRGLIHAAARAVKGRSALDFFPLLILIYFIIANITIDYILEFESFHWAILVLMLFLPSGKFNEPKSIA